MLLFYNIFCVFVIVISLHILGYFLQQWRIFGAVTGMKTELEIIAVWQVI